MKTVLVIDMPTIPENCMSCSIVCRRYQTEDTRPSLCPLRPLPEEMKEGFTHDFMVGWNACLDVITGETK